MERALCEHKETCRKSDKNAPCNIKNKKETSFKFLLILLVVAVYFVFISFEYGVAGGLLITILTWSFFVLCTPIADAGFLLDFPVRLLTKVRMLFSEMFVWGFSILFNIIIFLFIPEVYQKTLILRLFHHIFTQPWPFWSVIILSAIGTFVSIYLADTLYDVAAKKKQYKKMKLIYFIIVFAFIILIILVLYDFLLKQLGVNIPL